MKNEGKILGLIPARGGSKGVPRKNIRLLGGKPLIQYIFETARRSMAIDRLIISTEDEEIASVARSIGLEVPFLRPLELATDTASTISVLRHALNFFDELGEVFDAVISLQATNPLTSVATIDRAIEIWRETGCDSVTTISEVTQAHPYITKRLKADHGIEPFCVIPPGVTYHRRQDRERAYFMTGAVYMRGRELIEADHMDGHYLGPDARAVVVGEREAMDINTPLDFELMEYLMTKGMNRENPVLQS